MIPKIVLSKKMESSNGKLHGAYIYTPNSYIKEDCEIFINKDSSEPSDTLIHEIIHHTIREMKQIPEFEKIAHRIFRREDFVTLLSKNLSKNLIFDIYSKDDGKVVE